MHIRSHYTLKTFHFLHLQLYQSLMMLMVFQKSSYELQKKKDLPRFSFHHDNLNYNSPLYSANTFIPRNLTSLIIVLYLYLCTFQLQRRIDRATSKDINHSRSPIFFIPFLFILARYSFSCSPLSLEELVTSTHHGNATVTLVALLCTTGHLCERSVYTRWKGRSLRTRVEARTRDEWKSCKGSGQNG